MVDLISHALWAFAFFHNLSNAWLYVLFTLLPDLLWGVPSFAFLISTGRLGELRKARWRRSQNKDGVKDFRSDLGGKLYHLSHSWIAMGFVGALLLVFIPSIAFPFIGGVFLHLAFDLFLHKDSVFGQMPLYPLSSFRVEGFIHWSDRRLIVLNYALLTLAYFIIIAGRL